LPNSFGYHLLPLYGQEQIYKRKHFSKYLLLCSTGEKKSYRPRTTREF